MTGDNGESRVIHRPPDVQPYRVTINAFNHKPLNSFAAAVNDVDLELNASPLRLDIDWRYAKYAKENKVKIFINPDAHTLETLYDYRFGINIARKGWLEKADIANTMDAGQLDKYLKAKKGSGKESNGK